MILDILRFIFSIPFVVTFIVVSLSLYYYRIWKLKQVMPPGPWPIPILGNIMMLRGAKTMQNRLWELSKIYGDPFTFWFGVTRTIVCNKKESIREVLITQQNVFADRMDSRLFGLILKDGSLDIALGKYGPVWHLQRKIASRAMRHVIGRGLESKAEETVEKGIERLLKEEGPIKVSDHLANIVFNIICSYCYGQQYEVDDAEFQRLNYLNAKGNEIFVKAGIFDVLPYNQYIPVTLFPIVRQFISLFQEFMGIMDSKIKNHQETYQEGTVRDFVDAMIAEQVQLKKEGDKDVEFLNDSHLMLIVLDFFGAGTDTTQAVLTWFFLFMVMHPEIQERCYEEIEAATGGNKPGLGDRADMPFTEACILETLRMRLPAPLGIPHVNIAETKIGQYTIPKDTAAFANLYWMHMNPEGDFAQNPDQFDPELHFMKDGQLNKDNGHKILPFGGGKRVCLGEQLARNELFLITTSLLQRIKFSKVPGEIYSSEPDEKVDMIFYAKPYTVLIEKR